MNPTDVDLSMFDEAPVGLALCDEDAVGETFGTLPGQTPAGTLDAFVRRYDASGTEMWTRQFGPSAGDNARRVAVDQQGDIWVAGTADRGLPGEGAGTTFLRHFDVGGTVLWTDQFGTGQSDDAWDVAVDAEGAAYLVGTTEQALPGQRSAGRLDGFVRKYSVDGRELWTRQYGTPEDDHALAVALTSRGIAIAGSTRGTLADRAAGELDAYVMHLTGAGTP